MLLLLTKLISDACDGHYSVSHEAHVADTAALRKMTAGYGGGDYKVSDDVKRCCSC